MPNIRDYQQVTVPIGTDAFVIDRIGTGTEFIEYQYLVPPLTPGSYGDSHHTTSETINASGQVTNTSQVGIAQNLAFEFLGVPPLTNEVMGGVVFTASTSFPANFAGSYGYCKVNPTGTFVITVSKNGSNIGTISLSTGGVFTFSTSNLAVTVVAGDHFVFTAQSGVDATLADVFWTLAGAYT